MMHANQSEKYCRNGWVVRIRCGDAIYTRSSNYPEQDHAIADATGQLLKKLGGFRAGVMQTVSAWPATKPVKRF